MISPEKVPKPSLLTSTKRPMCLALALTFLAYLRLGDVLKMAGLLSHILNRKQYWRSDFGAGNDACFDCQIRSRPHEPTV